MRELFLVQSVYTGTSLDAMESSHAVEVVVKSADEINEIFDAISYAKGASIIE
jgi:aminopeptidase 2